MMTIKEWKGQRYVSKRSFDAGRVTRTTSDWNPGTTTADVEIAAYIQLLRARARDHEIGRAHV